MCLMRYSNITLSNIFFKLFICRCVKKECEVIWTCDKADPTHFLINGVKYPCDTDKICNDKIPPTECEA